MPAITRRQMLALGCSAAASPLITPVAFASLPTDHRLVVIILRGAMDGLDVVQPYGDPALARLRPGFDIGPDAGARDLDGFFALHPGLRDLWPLWQAGELGFAHAVSTPYRNARSHFDGQDLLEAGTGPGADARDGWLNRLVQTIPGATRETALAVGRDEALILRGAAPTSDWSPAARLLLSPATSDLLAAVYHDDPLFQASFDEAQFLSGLLHGDFSEAEGDGMMAGMQDAMAGAGQAEAVNVIADFAAERLRAEARIASFSIGGWDTHRSQQGGLTRALGHLSTAILRLRAGLGPDWGQTTVLAMTEFGRTAAENGSGGTDHGTGSALIMAGGAVRGGRVLGDWPGLEEAALFDRRDLMPTRDIRAYAGWAMAGLFGTDRDALQGQVFPGLNLGADPGLLR
ncbi:MAG: DUF1501 domain-containing protein [Alterinioella nitratireducens]|uniref:DUF1501 domain-containing protein n=1 Tax=Alterinioella nitratireducens TaxID=2735915 RepID=UPI00405A15C0